MPIERARNELVTQAFYKGCSHVLFIDDDIWPDSTYSAIKLVESNLPIIGGMCRRRKLGGEFIITPQNLQNERGVTEVKETGCGFLLIDMKVLENMAGQYPIDEYSFFEWSGSTRNPTSEDISFCRKAYRLGYKIYVDRDVTCGHHDFIIYDDSRDGFSPLVRK